MRAMLRLGSRLPLGGLAVLIGLLVAASPASAAIDATISAAPIGTGSYVVTVTNNSVGPISDFEIRAPSATNIAPSDCGPGTLGTKCTVTIAPGGSASVCYTGGPPNEFVTGVPLYVNGAPIITPLTMLSPVTSCPVGGWTAPRPAVTPPATPAPSPVTPATPMPSTTTASCVVPKLKGRKLADAKKAIVRAQCAVGSVRKAKSKRVKKGRVISQGIPAGKSTSPGTKVKLVVSDGR